MDHGGSQLNCFHGALNGVSVVVDSVEGYQVLHVENSFGTANKSLSNNAVSLTYEEAYFLSYALGCLTVSHSSESLDLLQQWKHFCDARKAFPLKFACYFHFRTKGWVPKEGLKYGADFVLYRSGPKYSHAEYAVIAVDASTTESTPVSWRDLTGAGRLLHSVAKDMIICTVLLPQNLERPISSKGLEIEEVLFSKWTSMREDLEEDTDASW